MEYARPARTPAALGVLKKVNAEGGIGVGLEHFGF